MISAIRLRLGHQEGEAGSRAPLRREGAHELRLRADEAEVLVKSFALSPARSAQLHHNRIEIPELGGQRLMASVFAISPFVDDIPLPRSSAPVLGGMQLRHERGKGIDGLIDALLKAS